VQCCTDDHGVRRDMAPPYISRDSFFSRVHYNAPQRTAMHRNTSQRTASFAAEAMGRLRLVGSLKLQVSFAKEPYKRDYILQKRLIILRSLLIIATP